MGVLELVATALPVDPTSGRARLTLTGPTGSLILPDSPSFSASGGIIDLTFGVRNCPIGLTADGLTVAIGPFLEAGPLAAGVSTVTVTAYESGSLQTGTLICTVTGGSTSAGGYGDGLYGEGLYNVGTGVGVATGVLTAAWSSGTITVH